MNLSIPILQVSWSIYTNLYIINLLVPSNSGPVSSGLSLDLQYGALKGYGHDMNENPGSVFTVEQELEITLSLYRRAICLTNELVLDVPISSCIPDSVTTDAIYEIKGTQYRFATDGSLSRQSFSLRNPIQRDSTGKLVYSTTGIPNFMTNSLITTSSDVSSSDSRK